MKSFSSGSFLGLGKRMKGKLPPMFGGLGAE
jgi:hypothetical protein